MSLVCLKVSNQCWTSDILLKLSFSFWIVYLKGSFKLSRHRMPWAVYLHFFREEQSYIILLASNLFQIQNFFSSLFFFFKALQLGHFIIINFYPSLLDAYYKSDVHSLSQRNKTELFLKISSLPPFLNHFSGLAHNSIKNNAKSWFESSWFTIHCGLRNTYRLLRHCDRK